MGTEQKKNKSVIEMLNNVLEANGRQEADSCVIPQPPVSVNSKDLQEDIKPNSSSGKNVFDLLKRVLDKKEEQIIVPNEVREAIKKKIDKGNIKTLLKDFLK